MNSENNNELTHEQELWDRIRTTEGIERAEALDDLSHLVYSRDDYKVCLQLVDTSIEIYSAHGTDMYSNRLAHLYRGKAFSLAALKRYAEAGAAFEILAEIQKDDGEEFRHAKRHAAMNWYEAKEYQKSHDGHTAAAESLDPDSTPYSIGIDNLNIGMTLSKLKEHRRAIKIFTQARENFKEAKNPDYVNWADNYLAIEYIALKNGPDAKFYATNYFNFSKVAEDLDMEGFARWRLGTAHRLCCEFDDAIRQLTRALELLTLEEGRDWPAVIGANRELCKALTATGRDDEAVKILERIKTIEETVESATE